MKKKYINQENQKRWFFTKKYPYSKFHLGDFLINIGIVIVLCITFSIILSFSDVFNQLSFWLLVLIVIISFLLIYYILKYSYKVLVNIKYGIRGLMNGTKLIFVVLLIVLFFQVYQISPNLLLIDKSIDNSSIGKDISNVTEIWEESITNITYKPNVFVKETINTQSSKKAASYIISCNESIIILDTKSTTWKIDITKKNEKCQIIITVIRDMLPDFTGKSMTCNCYSDSELFSVSKIVYCDRYSEYFSSDDGFKYCEGSLKDEYFRQMKQLWYS